MSFLYEDLVGTRRYRIANVFVFLLLTAATPADVRNLDFDDSRTDSTLGLDGNLGGRKKFGVSFNALLATVQSRVLYTKCPKR